MKYRNFLKQRSLFFFVVTLLVLTVSDVAHSQEVTILTPQNGATVSGTTVVIISVARDVQWSNFYLDGRWQKSTSAPPYLWNWNTTGSSDGSHTVSVNAYRADQSLAGQASINVTVSNGGGGGGGAGSWQVSQGARISSLTGASIIPGADTNPAHVRQYSIYGGGYPIMGGPLLDDWTAASFVKATQQSSIETGPNGYANQAANNYFNNIAASNPNDYVAQYNAFQSAYSGTGGETLMSRVDGGCPISNPTTAEAMQWAGLKWGINPLLLYAEATIESGWDQTAIGDQGGSSGLMQVADRGYNHTYPGFSGYGANLARENTCFNVDFYAAIIYGIYTGVIAKAPAGDIGAAIESWYSGYASAADGYANTIYGYMGNQAWVNRYFGGNPVPY